MVKIVDEWGNWSTPNDGMTFLGKFMYAGIWKALLYSFITYYCFVVTNTIIVVLIVAFLSGSELREENTNSTNSKTTAPFTPPPLSPLLPPVKARSEQDALLKENKQLLKQVKQLTIEAKKVKDLTVEVSNLTDEVSNLTEYAGSLEERIQELEGEAAGLMKKETEKASLTKEIETKVQKKFERLLGIVSELFPAAIQGVTTRSGGKKTVGTTSPRHIS